jgi:heme/copper-type cytochrome/quinol oxidase subunit 2
MIHLGRKTVIATSCVVAALMALPFAVRATGGAQSATREFTVDGDHFAFSPARIEVNKDDVVKISFHAKDIAHSFTIDNYRIAKRAAAGQTIVFEFRADQPGTHRFYCNLTTDERCKRMEGILIVR